jgi:hypothetical protein
MSAPYPETPFPVEPVARVAWFDKALDDGVHPLEMESDTGMPLCVFVRAAFWVRDTIQDPSCRDHLGMAMDIFAGVIRALNTHPVTDSPEGGGSPWVGSLLVLMGLTPAEKWQEEVRRGMAVARRLTRLSARHPAELLAMVMARGNVTHPVLAPFIEGYPNALALQQATQLEKTLPVSGSLRNALVRL